MLLKKESYNKWLVFFYSVPSKPVNNRIKIWRKLTGSGAIQFKGAVYALPYSEDHYEFFQWLVSEVISMKGDASFVTVDKIETMSNKEFIDLFNSQRDIDYQNIAMKLSGLERRMSGIKKGRKPEGKKLLKHINKCLKELREIRKIDFFSSKGGDEIEKRLELLAAESKRLSDKGVKILQQEIVKKSLRDYTGRTWVTRKRPFVDRMASAWLIRNFIDKDAVFKFIAEEETGHVDKDAVTFDMKGGEFTHVGDMCTFEVLIRSFNLRSKAVQKIAMIVHEIDLKDGKYHVPEAEGIEEILSGVKKSAKSDAEMLEKGTAVFEMLYAAKN